MSATATLEDRVAALERAIAELVPSSTLQPNVLSVDQVGNIGAAFTGKVTAEGLSVPTTPAGAGDGDHEIAFKRLDRDGSVAGEMLVLDSAARNATTMFIRANRLADALGVGIIAQANNASVGGQATIIDQAGKSSFPQIPNNGKFFIDTNNDQLYIGNINVPAQSFGQFSFNTTGRTSWTHAIPVGALNNTGTTNTPCAWIYDLTAPNTFTIHIANNSSVAGNYSWIGVVIGQ